MIYLNINIRNPRWWARCDTIKFWSGATPFRYKWWDVQILKNDNLLRLEFEITTQQDHAGCNLELGLFGYEIHFTFYDSRHWDYENNKWTVYDAQL